MAKYFSPEIETASRDYLHAVQSARLIKTVKRCYENIPFYKAKFDEIGLKPEDIHSIDDISKLPFTVKQDLRDHYPFGLFAVPREELVRVHASSGTTGKQTVVGYTRGDIDRRRRNIFGLHPRLLWLRTFHGRYGYSLRRGEARRNGYSRVLRQHKASGADSSGFWLKCALLYSVIRSVYRRNAQRNEYRSR